MTEHFTDRLHRLAEPIWQAQHAHPFVRGIGDGTLDLDRFKYWVRQDYCYLSDHARLLSIAASRAPDLTTTTRFADLARVTCDTEMALHRAYAERFGISSAALEAERPAPTTLAYANFLMRTALLGSYGELAAALLPCTWGFCEISQHLAEEARPSDSRFADWIKMYNDPAFARLSDWCRDLVDHLADGVSADERRRMEEAFLASSRYEYLFWEMAWNQEQWPVFPVQ